MNKIAVIMSVYKNDKLNYVKEAIESLYNQTYKNFDIFIQADGIIPQNIDSFLNEELEKEKIKYYGKRKKNMGLAYSLNELLNIVLKKDYKYIARMDADDIICKERLKKQLEFMKLNKKIDIVGTYIKEFSTEMNYKKIVTYPLKHENMFIFFKKRPPLAHVTVMFRKSFFKKAKLYPIKGHISNEDTLLWMNGFKNKCNFANIDYIGNNVRITKDFFNRRKNYKKAFLDFKNRLKVIKELNYSSDAYIYALAIFVINLLPVNLKKLAYKYLRK